MSFAASVGSLIICMIMQCQAELKVGDVLNEDLCCRIMHGHFKECGDELEPVCVKQDAGYISADNMCKLCAVLGNGTQTIFSMGDGVRKDGSCVLDYGYEG